MSKKIMFSDRWGLTAAVLAGTKTQTRRLVPDKLLSRYGHNKFNDRSPDLIHDAPFTVGEVVAIAQSYKELDKILVERGWKKTDDKLDNYYLARQFGYVSDTDAGWSNKMFVKAELMPHKIEITNIRVRRLQDISDEDCLAEGIVKYSDGVYTYIEDGKKIFRSKLDTPRKAYAELINKISGKGTWESNPCMFAYNFKLVDND